MEGPAPAPKNPMTPDKLRAVAAQPVRQPSFGNGSFPVKRTTPGE